MTDINFPATKAIIIKGYKLKHSSYRNVPKVPLTYIVLGPGEYAKTVYLCNIVLDIDRNI